MLQRIKYVSNNSKLEVKVYVRTSARKSCESHQNKVAGSSGFSIMRNFSFFSPLRRQTVVRFLLRPFFMQQESFIYRIQCASILFFLGVDSTHGLLYREPVSKEIGFKKMMQALLLYVWDDGTCYDESIIPILAGKRIFFQRKREYLSNTYYRSHFVWWMLCKENLYSLKSVWKHSPGNQFAGTLALGKLPL